MWTRIDRIQVELYHVLAPFEHLELKNSGDTLSGAIWPVLLLCGPYYQESMAMEKEMVSYSAIAAQWGVSRDAEFYCTRRDSRVTITRGRAQLN